MVMLITGPVTLTGGDETITGTVVDMDIPHTGRDGNEPVVTYETSIIAATLDMDITTEALNALLLNMRPAIN